MHIKGKNALNSVVLGARIRQARERQGLSQEELAALVSKDQRAVSDYENGKRKLSAVDLANFARVLNVSVLYFYEGEITVHDLEYAILKEFQQISTNEAKRALIEVARVFSDTWGQASD
jgi:transcriptional regulator with XRE-family HTH domain